MPVVTEVNYEEPTTGESAGISMAAGMFINNQASMVKPGQRKFEKDAEGYTQPILTFEGGS